MPSLYCAIQAPPDKHDDIVREINQWKYDVEGTVTKGKQSPAISEVKFYEVRVPEQIREQVSHDLGLYMHHKKFGTATSWKLKLLFWAWRRVVDLSPFNNFPKPTGKKKYAFSRSWQYVIPIGWIKRRPVKVVTGGKREVL